MELDIICNPDLAQNVITFVDAKLKGVLLDSFSGHIKFNIPSEKGIQLSQLFQLFEDNKKSLGISTYSISHTSLEQVFIRFAKKQID